MLEALTRPENKEERTGEMKLLEIERPENVVDLKDSIEIVVQIKRTINSSINKSIIYRSNN